MTRKNVDDSGIWEGRQKFTWLLEFGKTEREIGMCWDTLVLSSIMGFMKSIGAHFRVWLQNWAPQYLMISLEDNWPPLYMFSPGDLCWEKVSVGEAGMEGLFVSSDSFNISGLEFKL